MESDVDILTKDVDGYVTADGRKRFYKYENVKVEHHSSELIFNFEKEIRAKYWQIQRDDIVIDVGANFGSYTLPALARGAELVLAFEPGKKFVDSLRNNLRLNNWGDRCATIRLALGADDEKIDYSHIAMGMVYTGINNTDIEKIKITSLDNFLGNQYPFLSHIDWIKIDVEGMEMEVLKGAEFILRKYTPRLLVELHNSIHPDILTQVKDYLKEIAGVTRYDYIEPQGQPDTGYFYCNLKMPIVTGSSVVKRA